MFLIKVNQLMLTRSKKPTGTLIETFKKPAGVSNLYVQFGYFPQECLSYTQGIYLESETLILSIQTNKKTIKDDLSSLLHDILIKELGGHLLQ